MKAELLLFCAILFLESVFVEHVRQPDLSTATVVIFADIVFAFLGSLFLCAAVRELKKP